jgi:hypothetical protein
MKHQNHLYGKSVINAGQLVPEQTHQYDLVLRDQIVTDSGGEA